MLQALESTLASVIGPVSWALIHFVWQGSLVALGVAGFFAWQRRPNAVARYRVACVAMVLMILLPIATVSLHDRAQSTILGAGTGSLATALLGRTTQTANPAMDTSTGSTTNNAAGTSGPAVNAAPANPAAHRLLSLDTLRPWIFLVWFLGVVVLSLVNIVGWRQAQRLKFLGTQTAPVEWQKTVARLCRRLGIRKAVRIFASTRVDVPTVIGWLRPIVVMPVGAMTGMQPQHIESILAHELAHIHRRDYLINLVQVAAETLLFFHPAVWWVSRQIRIERENCCDDLGVTMSASRVTYARALIWLEKLRHEHPQFAMHADGGSLSDRIRRLTGGRPMLSHRPNRPRLSGVLFSFLLVLSASMMGIADDGREALAGPPEIILPAEDEEVKLDVVARTDVAVQFPLALVVAVDTDPQADDVFSRNESRFTTSGEWRIKRYDDHLSLQVRGERRNHSFSMTVQIEEDELERVVREAGEDFVLEREAGTFYFTGDLNRGRWRGRGDFGFVPSDEYKDDLERLGVRGLNERRMMLLAAMDISSSYVKELKGLGYDRISGEKLVKLAIHGVSLDFVRGMKDLGFEDLSLSEMVKMRIHGLSTEFSTEMAELGYTGLSGNDLVKWRIHGVSPEFIRGMRESGYKDVQPETLVKWRIHGVSPSFVRGMSDAGLKDLTSNELVKMRIHGVTPEFVTELAELGYDDVSVEDLVSMRIHGVTPAFIERLHKKGIKDLSIKDLRSIKIHGIRLDR